MAEKISTLILKVDLDCRQCYKKIRKVLCKLQEKEDIVAIFYDEKNKTVMISGRFNPDKVSDWLCYKACKIIKEIEIKDEKPKNEKAKDEKPKNEKAKDEKPKNEKSKDEKPKDEKPKNDKPKDDKPKIVKFKDDKPKDDKPKSDKSKDDKPKPAESEGKPKLVPQKSQLEPPRTEPVVVGGYGYPQLPYQTGWPVAPPGPSGPGYCCFRPIYEGYYGGSRCCTCGRVFGYMAGTPQMGFFGGGGVPAYGEYKGCQVVCEEEPSTCSIM